MKNIIIRSETEKDYYEAELVTQRAFYNVYTEGCEEHLLLNRLRNDPDYIKELSYIAEIDGKIVGGIYASKAMLVDSLNSETVLSFGPVSVDPDYQKTGIGTMLVNKLICEAKKRNYKAIIITGVPNYYPRFGFKSCFEINIFVEDNVQFPALMGLELESGFFKKHSGQFNDAASFHIVNTRKQLDEYDKNFPPLKKEKLSSQWKIIN